MILNIIYYSCSFGYWIGTKYLISKVWTCVYYFIDGIVYFKFKVRVNNVLCDRLNKGVSDLSILRRYSLINNICYNYI